MPEKGTEGGKLPRNPLRAPPGAPCLLPPRAGSWNPGPQAHPAQGWGSRLPDASTTEWWEAIESRRVQCLLELPPTHTQIHTQTYTHLHSNIDHAHRDTHSDSQAHILTQIHTGAHTQRHMYQIHTYRFTLTLIGPREHRLTWTRSNSCTHILTCILTPRHSDSHAHIHSHVQTHSQGHTWTHMHT